MDFRTLERSKPILADLDQLVSILVGGIAEIDQNGLEITNRFQLLQIEMIVSNSLFPDGLSSLKLTTFVIGFKRLQSYI